MNYNADKFHNLLKMAVKNSVSDIHLRCGEQPYFRMRGSLKKIKGPVLEIDDFQAIVKLLVKEESVAKSMMTLKELDGSYQYDNVCRVRFNLLKFQGKFALILRVITMHIPTIDELKLPDILKGITHAHRGLVLVTGVTGSGKSSTLAAIIEEINLKRDEHILTIEDPVEFLFSSKKCRITQRDIGPDTDNFKVALRGALRQDPDIIVIGELRDTETIQIAMKAAETGHLVFGTVHTTDAVSTINRVVAMFPAEEQKNVKLRLADCLHATISQRLLPTLDGKGRAVAQEIMVNQVGIKDCIAGKESLENIYVTVEKSEIMQSFDQHLTQLFLEEKISKEVALDAATHPTNFELNLELGSSSETGEQEENSNGGDSTIIENDPTGSFPTLTLESKK